MYFATTLFLLILAIALHELGHALAMRRHGVPIEEICLLGFGPTLFSMRLKRFFPGTILSVRLIPLGAFVKPKAENGSTEKDALAHLNRTQQAHIAAAGPGMNLLLAGVLGLFLLQIEGGFFVPEAVSEIFYASLVMLGIGGILMRPGIASEVLLLFLGLAQIPIIVLLMWSIGPLEANGTIISVVVLGNQLSVSMVHSIYFGATLSMAIGLANALPFPPLDGGRVAAGVLRPYLSENQWWWTEKVLVSFLLGLIVLSFAGDTNRIWNLF